MQCLFYHFTLQYHKVAQHAVGGFFPAWSQKLAPDRTSQGAQACFKLIGGEPRLVCASAHGACSTVCLPGAHFLRADVMPQATAPLEYSRGLLALRVATGYDE